MGKLNNTGMLDERKDFIVCNSQMKDKKIKCDTDSVEGSVSQRACVYCGARVVLNPITDAYHIVHGPIGCASYTWDIRGSLTSDSEVFRNSFSTDLREQDIIFGGEKKLEGAIEEIVKTYKSELIFVYATCVVGVIGDDIDAVCRNMSEKHGIKIIPVKSSGFAGNKSTGYKAACNAILDLVEDGDEPIVKSKTKVNYMGDFNLAGEIWILTDYLKEIGLEVETKITGDSTFRELKNAKNSALNIVQCAGSMIYLAKEFEDRYKIPFIRISFFGIEDTIMSLRTIASTMSEITGDKNIITKTEFFIERKLEEIGNKLDFYRNRLKDKKAAVYVGGGFKAISLIKQFRDLGMETVMVGTQTGRPEEYETIRRLADTDTVILDDANPTELEHFMRERGADILVGGVKERPLAYKLGVSFLDHNHERKHPLCGFEGSINFAKEAYESMLSPVWDIVREYRKSVGELNG
ncbi:MAG: nitrogenase iron-molybdenum cofactor biosynthesis protein NifE [Fusobacteriaceae bacterium]|jgi:nitrogenase molybdenum-cofactor synthesis protein NifE|nr:nitrogenase iron-molybdenum cofactor biosynthesis protein NifE [Fusobacteriaceae bacterium]MBP6467425.1 nitrogenase iron-molybdenum cofactor biosynthesis protein NifE [Fusobacteriaceae bacterium]MBP9596504.1 nitrogenase iron-molybdenum cofactor biosynthesis protein NifE [Fusobacteriaceae bacterium]